MPRRLIDLLLRQAWRKFACEGKLMHYRLEYDRMSREAGDGLKALIVDRDALQRERRALADEKKALAGSALEHLEWIESEYKSYIQEVQADKRKWQVFFLCASRCRLPISFAP